MVPVVFAGNISAEATTPAGNIFAEAMRGPRNLVAAELSNWPRLRRLPDSPVRPTRWTCPNRAYLPSMV